MRLVKGVGSFLRKLVEIDFRVVSYQLFGPNPPRIVWLGPAVGIAGLIVGVFQNPAAGITLALLLCVAGVFLLYLVSNAPPLRWHILSDDVRYSFSGVAEDALEITDTLSLRAMRKWCDSITYPVSQFRGAFTLLEVSQDGQRIAALAADAGTSEPGYTVERLGQEAVRIVIRFRRVIHFGQTTMLVVRYACNGGGAGRTESHDYVVNTFTDALAITVCFHRTSYPRSITASSTFGIRYEELEFLPQRRAEGDDHICETWRPPSPKYLRTYSLRWVW